MLSVLNYSTILPSGTDSESYGMFENASVVIVFCNHLLRYIKNKPGLSSAKLRSSKLACSTSAFTLSFN